ncbi:polysaccharide deacetylase family protein [Pseudomonas cremoricolorata]|uniref:Polysaccharide deacetylase n=1 Tax=Pseudomonas cremoricolorata TaxID=157783 RepID=A0A089WW36_9PSED|nr:polysaccharide deacetylase family protein [Pseudomonas cremoricolorata]AIR90817.1 polysaccharide deacetylase [Pseudomonas cremoricolorata]
MSIKTFVKCACGWLYLNSAKGRRQLRERGVILMLHRVVQDDASAELAHRNELCVGAESFAGLLEWLREHFDCVPLMTLLDPPTAPRPGQRPPLALTFDDGWRDNAVHAFPLLRQYQVPASIFLSTDYIDSRQRFWWESIGETLWGSHGVASINPLLTQLQALGRPVPASVLHSFSNEARSRVLAGFLQSLKSLPPAQLHALTDACPLESLPQALDWHQVRQLEGSGLISFGPHGASHALLPGLSDEALHAELSRSRVALQEGCLQPLPVYCYPNGDHDARVRRQVAAQQYRYALGTRAAVCAVNDDPLALPRIGVSQRSARHPSLLAWRMSRGVPA